MIPEYARDQILKITTGSSLVTYNDELIEKQCLWRMIVSTENLIGKCDKWKSILEYQTTWIN